MRPARTPTRTRSARPQRTDSPPDQARDEPAARAESSARVRAAVGWFPSTSAEVRRPPLASSLADNRAPAAGDTAQRVGSALRAEWFELPPRRVDRVHTPQTRTPPARVGDNEQSPRVL